MQLSQTISFLSAHASPFPILDMPDTYAVLEERVTTIEEVERQQKSK